MPEKPRARFEMVGGGGSEPNHPQHADLILNYDQKEARIRVVITEHLFEKEPLNEVARRELQRVLRALREVAESPEGIEYNFPHR